MRRVIQTTIMAVAMAFTLTACNINDDYDLSKIDGGDFVLGDEDSTFSLPLASISISINTLFYPTSLSSYNQSQLTTAISKSDEVSYYADEIVKLLNALLPSEMPAGYEDGIDLDYLNVEAYVRPVIEALVTELKVSNTKRLLFSEALLDNSEFCEDERDIIIYDFLDMSDKPLAEYTAQEVADLIYDYLCGADSPTNSYEVFVDTIVDAIIYQDFSTLTNGYIGSIEDSKTQIDSSVIDILKDSLEGAEFNVQFYYNIDTNLTFTFYLDVKLINTSTGAEYVLGGESGLTTITDKDELESLISNLMISYEVDPSTYSLSTGGLEGKYFNLKLMAKKKGALIL
ncbi:MAG: hypothetical protein SNG35_07660 [Rikenellaceae bacterium]